MHVISEKRIREAKTKWPNTATALDYWYQLAKGSKPSDFAAMRAIFPAVDKVGEHHVFDIGGNKLRLIAFVRYRSQKLYIKHVLDHREYDRGKWKEERA
ncbi:MAG: type II toxin-antitoxin system HigB family toxin [Pseudomonas sp.]|uniref:type II toxin-antitoxin system HigB family toxin n=1 Tax=Pseudomonas sp. AL03 TaxID=3042230 RepID=UPI00249BE5F9|nr:type II toxin-antitoxin system HigB family toxin [Pseudomonas sp. AL03]MDI3274361.1 type II toxin-antitoxin system HigB family toxin [Pseudomonas sp. AL03]